MKLFKGVHLALASFIPVLLMIAVAAAADMRIQQKQVAPAKKVAPSRMQQVAPKIQKVPGTDMRPDLAIGACQIECSQGGVLSTQICQQYGYSDQFTYRVLSVISNDGGSPASIEEGWRIWGATHQVDNGAPAQAGYPQDQAAPPGGMYLTEGTEVVPGKSPKIVNLKNLAPGVHTIVFTADPDNHIAEKSETNNTSQCSWTVVSGPPIPPYDFALTNVSVSPPSGTPTTEFHFTTTVKNLGGSTNSNWNVTCVPGGGYNRPGLEANETFTYTLPVHGTLTPGQKTMTCSVHSLTAGEQNTSNNTATTTFTVTQP